eukprot:scaffold6420_cov168-Amphora_coffeaeformis.AAC.42
MVPSNQAVEKALPVRYFVGRHIHHHQQQQQLRCESTTNQPPPPTTTVGPGHETTPSASGVSTNVSVDVNSNRHDSIVDVDSNHYDPGQGSINPCSIICGTI